jgi:transposase
VTNPSKHSATFTAYHLDNIGINMYNTDVNRRFAVNINMFFRKKKVSNRVYLQIVENRWENKQCKQRVLCTLGRLDKLTESTSIDSLIKSGAKFAQTLMILSSHKKGQSPAISTYRIGPSLIFERLWKETGCRDVIKSLLLGRNFQFDVERAIFLTVLHRLFVSGSDRQAERWKEGYHIDGVEHLQLHHLYRAMGWLGEELPMRAQCYMTRYAPRCIKDLIEEELFHRKRDLFTSLDVVFFDTTSIYFEGQGGDTLGEYGKSKDHRNDCKQIVVGAVLDNEGRPICCEIWPGNAADVKSLIPVVDRLKKRFKIGQVCIVADRGMISAQTIKEVERRQWKYILGVRMRNQKEARDKVLSNTAPYQVIHPKGQNSKDPSPLQVKEVMIEKRRYIVCLNEDEAKKEAADREAILCSLKEKLKKGSKALVGNKGYRRYLKSIEKGFEIDEDKIKEESRYDGRWVLRTNTKLDAADVALKYKELWTVENLFRSIKSIVHTRPVFHKCDETIIGHVFCSFLALVLMKELSNRLQKKGWNLEWQDVIRDLERLEEIVVEQDDKRFLLRNESVGSCGKVFQATGVAMPPTVRQIKVDNKKEMRNEE